MQKSDLLVAVGARFDDRVTGRLDSFATGARVVHIDVDPAEIGKNRAVDVPIVGDARSVLHELCNVIAATIEERGAPDYSAWVGTINQWKAEFPLRYDQQPDGPLKPQHVIEKIGEITGGNAIYVSGVGQHQMWASQHLKFKRPNTWINSGGLGTMGFAVPAAMGAKVGRPDTPVWAIDGDGCFQMTNQELATMTIERIPVKIAIINNGSLGMVRQWQELFYDERYSQVRLPEDVPDYVKLAEAYGCVGLRCETPDALEATIRKAAEIDDRTVVIDFRVDQREKCYPMVPAGASNDEVILGPEFEKDHDDLLHHDSPEGIF